MKKQKMLNIYFKYLILISILLANTISISAATNTKKLKLSFKIVEKNLETIISKQGEGIIINTKNSKNNKKAYVYLHQNKKDNWKFFNGFIVEVENKNNSSQKINFHIETTSKIKFKLKKSSSVFLENLDKSKIQSSKKLIEGIQIPPRFKGKIYVGFDDFISEDNKKLLDKTMLSKIQSWGITFIPSNEQDNKISLMGVVLLPKEEMKFFEQFKKVQITGEDKVQIPVLGESIAQYKLVGQPKNSKIKFSLMDEYKNISISNRGVLKLNKKVLPGKIVLQVNVEGKLNFKKTISLVKSWAINKKDKDGVPYALVSPSDSKAVKNMSKINLIDNSVKYVRILFVLICFACGILYLYWKKHKSNKL